MKAAITTITEEAIERFWSHVDIRGADECWPWKAAKWKAGYGVFAIRHGVLLGAHQVAAYIGLGCPDPITLYALHTCDNPPCCNYNHLFYGTHRDNQIDAASKGRHRLQRNPDLQSGVKNPNCKLSPDQVAAIRASGLNSVELSSVFGVSSTHIRDIRKGLWWKSSTI